MSKWKPAEPMKLEHRKALLLAFFTSVATIVLWGIYFDWPDSMGRIGLLIVIGNSLAIEFLKWTETRLPA